MFREHLNLKTKFETDAYVNTHEGLHQKISGDAQTIRTRLSSETNRMGNNFSNKTTK